MNFDFLFEIFGYVLSALYDIYASYGFTIIGLTLVVMIIVTPLTLKATRSMLMMQQLQPEMKKIQSKYKDDRQKLNEELLKFYKENNINPVGGCLPLLIQMPVFLVLYNVLRGLTLRDTLMGSNVGAVVGQAGVNVPLTKPPVVIHTFDPQYLPDGSKLAETLHGVTQMRWLGIDLAESFTDAFSNDVVRSLPYLLLIVVVAITGFVQQRQIQGRAGASSINPQQQQIMKIMPIFLPLFSLALPSGLVLYFFVSNLYRVGQQGFITRSIYGPHHAANAEKNGEVAPAKPKGSLGSSLKALTGKVVEDLPEAPAAKGKPAKGTAVKSAGSKSAAKATPARPAAKGGTKTKPEPVKAATKARSGSRSGASPANAKSKNAGRPDNRPAKPGRADAAKKPDATPKASGAPASPALQPRARKKKR